MKDFEALALPEESVSFDRDIFSVPVIVAALGYFVDIYDLIHSRHGYSYYVCVSNR